MSKLEKLFPLPKVGKSRFKIGDSVRLLEGSPTMIVVDIEVDPDRIVTAAFYGPNKGQEASWLASDLTGSLSFL